MPPETIIRSRQNPIYKQIRSLLRRDRRHQERAFLVEGPRFIADALAAGTQAECIVIAESTAGAPTSWPRPLDTPIRVLSDELFDTISDTVTSQGAIAAFRFPDLTVDPSTVPLIVVADGIQDPGNLGTLIRSAAGAGGTQVLTLPGTVDPWSPKVVRSAAGAHFIVPIAAAPPEPLETAIPLGARVIGTDARAELSYDDIDLTDSCAIIIGAEGHGLSKSSDDAITDRVSIPLASGLESLNAGVAGSILLFEAARQRRIHSRTGQNPSI
ncbi:MAG: RNA methyltransferase [Thermomicrobiales bacterium]|nr:RNA methyltransferase [Thermomicrobiales bacterium]